MDYTKTVKTKGKKAAKRITDIPEVDVINSKIRQTENDILLTMVQLTLNHPKIVNKRLALENLDRELNKRLVEFGFVE